MSIKSNLQLKVASFAQNGGWLNWLIKIALSPLCPVLIFSAIIRLCYCAVLLTTQAVDTATYINYHANILKGETEALRTPVYPYFIKLIGLFGPQNLIDDVVKVQIVISFLSIIIFYKIMEAICKNRWIIFVASLIYGMLLPVINFDKMVLTESLSISCLLFFIYMLIGYLQKPGNFKAWMLTLFVLIAIMLRPSFIYLLPLIVIFWLSRLVFVKAERKMCRWGLVVSGIVFALLKGYAHLNKKNVDFNGISVVSNNNQMAVMVSAGIYMHGNDPEISDALKYNIALQQKNGGKPTPGINIMKRFDADRVHVFIVNCIKNEPLAYIRYIGHKLLALRSANIFTIYADHDRSASALRVAMIERVFYLPFILIYAFIIVGFGLMMYILIKRKRILPIIMFLWLVIVLQLAVAIMGGYSEYQRLILPAIPAMIILLFSYLDKAIQLS